MEMPQYRELWFLGGEKLSKKAEETLKTTLVLEDQSRQQMIKMWKWCIKMWM
jgi:transposase